MKFEAERLLICLFVLTVTFCVRCGLARATQGGAQPVPAQNAANLPGDALTPPSANTSSRAADRFEGGDSIENLPSILLQQWMPEETFSRLSVGSPGYTFTKDRRTQRLTLKQAIYIALRNNPAILAAQLNPVSGIESVRAQNGIFDPDLTSALENEYSNMPVTTPIEVAQGLGLSTNIYQWNFGVNKILATTNGTLGFTFNNQYQNTNNTTETINPSYVPTLAVSLSQPLMRNFGWKFATINVQLAESARKRTQWQYAQSLSDFVQQTGMQYWAVAGTLENLRVTREALKFYEDLVRQNTLSWQVGTLAKIDLDEAQSAAATARANFYSSQAALESARATLRQAVMLNPGGTLIPEAIEPSQRPDPKRNSIEDFESALRTAIEYRPSLGAMRESIRTALLQVRYQQNQLLPQINAQAQIALTNQGGVANCGLTFGVVAPNCAMPGGTGGYELPFSASYGETLNKVFDFSYYSYTGLLTYERPLENANARAAYAQQRIAYEQIKLQYRAAVSQAVSDLESALANLRAYVQAVTGAQQARAYAEEALQAERSRFKVGMATTHDLLQYESQLIAAQGNEVQAEIGLENARLALWHADGTLLRHFQIQFTVQKPEEPPWYARL